MICGKDAVNYDWANGGLWEMVPGLAMRKDCQFNDTLFNFSPVMFRLEMRNKVLFKKKYSKQPLSELMRHLLVFEAKCPGQNFRPLRYLQCVGLLYAQAELPEIPRSNLLGSSSVNYDSGKILWPFALRIRNQFKTVNCPFLGAGLL
jgi:hypothetical protein